MSADSAEKHWKLIEPIWETIEIYDGPEVFRRTYDSVPRKAGLLFAAHSCQSEVCNGWFRQFFWNSTGVLAPEAVEGMKAIGCPEMASVIQTAIDRLVVSFVRERPARQALIDALPHDYFDEQDEHFFRLIHAENGGFEKAADRFAAQPS
jgi:hypothetical protein